MNTEKIVVCMTCNTRFATVRDELTHRTADGECGTAAEGALFAQVMKLEDAAHFAKVDQGLEACGAVDNRMLTDQAVMRRRAAVAASAEKASARLFAALDAMSVEQQVRYGRYRLAVLAG